MPVVRVKFVKATEEEKAIIYQAFCNAFQQYHDSIAEKPVAEIVE
jgi:hypothetical protein